MLKLIKLFFVFLTFTLNSAFADLSDILKKGEVKIAVPEAFPPFGAVGKSGEHEGYDVDVAKLICLLYTSPSPRDFAISRMPSSA